MSRHEKTAKRVLKARHGRGCKRAKDTKCKCPGCARVALLLRAADTLGGEACGDGAPSRWLRVLDYTEGAAAGRLPVRQFGETGQYGSGNHQFRKPRGVCVDPGPDGHLYVCDSANHRVQVLHKKDGTHVRTIGTTGQKGTGNDQFSCPWGVCVEPGPGGRLLYVADTVAADVLTAVGRRDRLCRLLDGAPPSSAREALSRHLARGSV